MSSRMIKSAPMPTPQESTATEVQEILEDVITLPPVIINNPREKIEPEMIPSHFIRKKKPKLVEKKKFAALIWLPKFEAVKPVPKHPINISWSPKELCFKIDKNVVEHKLHLCNRSAQILYIAYGGLWNDNAKLGASWKCYPQTRFLLAPGMDGTLFIRAKPRESSTVPHAFAGLQLAAAHPRDNVTGYFVVPVAVDFHNYIPCESHTEIEAEQITVETETVENTSGD